MYANGMSSVASSAYGSSFSPTFRGSMDEEDEKKDVALLWGGSPTRSDRRRLSLSSSASSTVSSTFNHTSGFSSSEASVRSLHLDHHYTSSRGERPTSARRAVVDPPHSPHHEFSNDGECVGKSEVSDFLVYDMDAFFRAEEAAQRQEFVQKPLSLYRPHYHLQNRDYSSLVKREVEEVMPRGAVPLPRAVVTPRTRRTTPFRGRPKKTPIQKFLHMCQNGIPGLQRGQWEVVLEDGVLSYFCQFCSGKFGTTFTLKQHIRFVHFKDRPHSCGMCAKKFRSMYDLRRHSVTHTNERFACLNCGTHYSSRQRISTHMRVCCPGHRAVSTMSAAYEIAGASAGLLRRRCQARAAGRPRRGGGANNSYSTLFAGTAAITGEADFRQASSSLSFPMHSQAPSFNDGSVSDDFILPQIPDLW